MVGELTGKNTWITQ